MDGHMDEQINGGWMDDGCLVDGQRGERTGGQTDRGMNDGRVGGLVLHPDPGPQSALFCCGTSPCSPSPACRDETRDVGVWGGATGGSPANSVSFWCRWCRMAGGAAPLHPLSFPRILHSRFCSLLGWVCFLCSRRPALTPPTRKWRSCS